MTFAAFVINVLIRQMMFSVPIYFQLTQNASTSRAGAQLVPAVVGNAVGGILCGIFINRYIESYNADWSLLTS